MGFLDKMKNMSDNLQNTQGFHPTHRLDCLQIDSNNKLFKVKGQSANAYNKNKHGFLSNTMAFTTMGMSRIAEKAAGSMTSGLFSKVYKFSDLNSFELLEDDSTVTTGGVGRAIVGAAITQNYLGAIAGGVTAHRKTKKIVNNLVIKLNVNDFDNPCIIIPIISKPTKTTGNDYKNAYNQAQKILSMLDLITHNN